jgi:hypothetical protein
MKRTANGFWLSILTCIALRSDVAVAQERVETYSEVRIHDAGIERMADLASSGVGLDHIRKGPDNSIEAVLNHDDITLLEGLGVRYEVLISDLSSFYARRASLDAATEQNLEAAMKQEYGIEGFEFGSMGGYYTFNEVVAELDSFRQQHPSLVTVKQSIGVTLQGRDLWMVKISDNADTDEAEPEVLYTGLHHAREPQSMACVMYFMNYLLENYGTDDEVTYIVDNRELYFIPVVNPDGYVYNQTTNPNGGGLWRKNRRNNGNGTFGVDLNRNYGYEWGHDNTGSSGIPGSETYRGPSPFSELETQAVRDFVNNHSLVTALNYHSFSDLLIYPWGYISNFVTPDSGLFIGMADDMTQTNGYDYGTANQTVGYLVNGEANDWMYGEQATKPKILAMTPEVGGGTDGFWPNQSRIFPLAEENVYPNLQMAWGPEALFTPDLSLSSTSGTGTFQYTFSVTNTSSIRQTPRIMVKVTGPNGYSATAFDRTRSVGPSATFSRTNQFRIRNGAAGEYTVTLAISDPANVWPLGSTTELYTKTSVGIAGSNEEDVADRDLVTSLSNYPNPFNPSTTFRYLLNEPARVSLKLYSVLGQEVRTLVDHDQAAGDHSIVWDGTNAEGMTVSTGLYLYRLTAGSVTKTGQLMLVK